MTRPTDVWNVLNPYIGLSEQPDGSNHAPPITDWYYGWRAPWCAMTCSFGLARAGFSDDGGKTLNLNKLIGITQTTAKGWAYVPYVEKAFRDAGRFDSNPREGDLGINGDASHIWLVTGVNSDGTHNTLEGNYGNRLTRGRRHNSSCRGFCHIPYDGAAPSGPTSSGTIGVPAFPGTTRRGNRGSAVRQVQQRLADRGWEISVDGDFGPTTDRIVRNFQSDKRLGVDGVVGPITWTSMWTSPIT